MQRSLPLFLTAGFRFFFLSGAVLSVMTMTIWTVWYALPQFAILVPAPDFAVAPQHWHAHEMIFGYGVAILAGFFLTAVPNWTGTGQMRPYFILGAGSLWLLGRAAVWLMPFIPAWLAAMLDLAFLPVLSLRLAANLLKRPKNPNTALLGLLALIFAGNAMVHLEWAGLTADTARGGLWMALLAISAFISVIGGRILPGFTRNVMVRQGAADNLPSSHAFAERSGVIAAVILGPLVAFGAPEPVLGLAALGAAMANGWRLRGWRTRAILGDPLLWALHLGFGMLVLGYALLALAWLTGLIAPVSALHGLSIGAVGGMTMAMMTRAPLGHTGRPLRAGRLATVAYLLIAGAMAVRVAGAELMPSLAAPAVLVSGAMWVTAFGLYLIAYWPVLTGPKASA